MDFNTKNYELAYLLSPSLSEQEVLTRAGKLAKLIEEAGGRVRQSEEPRKRRLAYEIKKEKNAYFGLIVFAMAPHEIAGLEKKLKPERLLRFLIVEEAEVDTRPQPQILRVVPSRPAPTYTRVQPKETPQPEEKLDLEALDKKLEEILGK